MTSITITRFENGQRSYNRHDQYKVEIAPDERMNALVTFIENCSVQVRDHNGPSGLSFCKWVGQTQTDANFREAYALALDWDWANTEELMSAAKHLPFAHVWYTGENKARTLNTITLLIPFHQPANKDQYERIAACIVKELDVYGLVNGALAVNHITNLHGNILSAYERGTILDPKAYIARTAKIYQGRDATKYYGKRPAPKTPVEPVKELDDTGLFEFTLTPEEIRTREAEAIMRAHGLTN